MKEIVFVRHAESQANRDGVWNGRSDGPLSSDGVAQLEQLSTRLANSKFDLVVSSPLERARQTAESFADTYEIDDQLIEIDLGRWEGWVFDEVQAQDGDLLKQAVSDRVTPMGASGESLNEAGKRIMSAVDKLVESVPDGSRVAVVTHGGLLQTALHKYMPGDGKRVHAFVGNTSLTRLMFFDGYPSRLAGFNDTGHLGPQSKQVREFLDSGNPVVALVRHGQTKANVEQRWQGQGDWDLNELGYRQAKALGDYYGQWDQVFSSPLKRAKNTAGFVASTEPALVDDLKELNMGVWEGLTTTEIEERWPKMLERIYRHGEDLKRGTTGESWAELTNRFRNAVHGLDLVEQEPTVVVAHGGAIRSYISSLTATTDTYAESLFTPPNTSVTHVAMTDRGPQIVDYAVAPHLKDLES